MLTATKHMQMKQHANKYPALLQFSTVSVLPTAKSPCFLSAADARHTRGHFAGHDD